MNGLYSEIWDKVDGLLDLGKEGGPEGERDLVSGEWSTLSEVLPVDDADPMSVRLLEDLLFYQVLGARLAYRLGQDGVLVPVEVTKTRGAWVSNPALELWAKNQERCRKTMKELLERLKRGEPESGESLGELMVPVLEKGEGVLDDALEFEARKKSVEEAGNEPGGDPIVAESS